MERTPPVTFCPRIHAEVKELNPLNPTPPHTQPTVDVGAAIGPDVSYGSILPSPSARRV
jgi:hypothetical protein